MAKYSFSCPNGHGEVEVSSPMGQIPEVICPQCESYMERVYYPPRAIAFSPFEVLTDWMIHNYHRKKAGLPLVSKDKVKRPEPIPNTLYDTRKYKEKTNVKKFTKPN